MRTSPEISFLLQLKFLALYLASMLCALWMHGEPNLTFACLAAGPVFMLLSRISLRWFPGWMRQIFQLGVAGIAVYWLQMRMMQIPMDSALIELTAILLPALFLGASLREHNLLWLGCLGFAGYGGMHPARSLFLPSFLGVIMLSILILYQTRIALLAKLSKEAGEMLASRQFHWENWFYRSLHFLLVLLIVALFSSQFSIRNKTRSMGLIPVSFRTDQEQQFPDVWQKWAAPTKELLLGEKGTLSLDSAQNPTLLDLEAKSVISDGSFAVDGDNGSGSGMGQDLVFRAFTPAKLYWVMQIYDHFDGKLWTRSKSMTSSNNGLDSYRSLYQSEVVQNISIVKPMGRTLPYAYWPQQFFWNDQQELDSVVPMGVIRREDRVVFKLKNEKLPSLPWQYSVISRVPDPARSVVPRAWREPERNFGWNYRQLPRQVFSKRMYELAENITREADSPMQKALVLRDYLRQNYAYTLQPQAPPKGKELTDYFLFEDRRGYCQHFAQAYTVLARMIGLHSRLVTGYSPGNFNLLSNCFEVYEYHGHAWTQIFIEPYGWMTFDSTPPGALQLQDNPPLLKPLLDPFGKQWQVEIPELSARSPVPSQASRAVTEQASKRNLSKSAQKQSEMQKKVAQVYEQIYSKAITDNAEANPDARQIGKAALLSLWQKSKGAVQQALQELRRKIESFGERLLAWLEALGRWLLARSLADCLKALLALSVIVLICSQRRRWLACLDWRWRLLRCDFAWRRLQRQALSAPQQVQACQALLLDWLGLAGLRRRPFHDLLEYADTLQQRLPKLCNEYRLVAACACESWYGRYAPGKTEAAKVLALTAEFRRKIKPHLRRKNNFAH
ncbi:MAG: transglutaminase-like domain-containing protein [Lentisphaeria bacterium]|nr:transglutaminase-like domain-containing protein [Lentisphaeria bacterium]